MIRPKIEVIVIGTPHRIGRRCADGLKTDFMYWEVAGEK